jgi:hypothetical protein
MIPLPLLGWRDELARIGRVAEAWEWFGLLANPYGAAKPWTKAGWILTPDPQTVKPDYRCVPARTSLPLCQIDV